MNFCTHLFFKQKVVFTNLLLFMNQNYNPHFAFNRSSSFGLSFLKDFLRLKLLGRSCLLLLLFVFYQNESYGQTYTQWGNCLAMKGVSHKTPPGIDMQSVFNPIAGSPFTIEFWLAPSYSSSYSTVLTLYTAGSPGALAFGMDNNWISFSMSFAQLDVPVTGSTNSTIWRHFAITWANGIGKIYRDGVLIGSKSMPNSFSSSPIYAVLGPGANIEIDELRFWTYERSQSQIQSNMYNATMPASTSGLWAYFQFNEGVAGGNNSSIHSLIDATGHTFPTFYNLDFRYNPSNTPGIGDGNFVARSPIVTTPNFSNVQGNSATFSANVTDWGSGDLANNTSGGNLSWSIVTMGMHWDNLIVDRGFVWSTSDQMPEIGKSGVTRITGSAGGLGTYTLNSGALPLGSDIYFRAYVLLNNGSIGYTGTAVLPSLCPIFTSTNLGISPTPVSADFSWGFTGTFEWKVVAAGAGLNGTPFASGSSSYSASVTGLTPNTNYEIYIKSAASGCNTWYSVPFSTLSCTTPSSLSASNVLYGGATLSWTAIPGVSNYSYKAVASGAGVNGTVLGSGTFTTNTNSAAITGLVGGGSYDVYLQANCTPSISSAWSSAPASFTTLSCTSIPTNLFASNISYSTCNATWNSSVSNVQGYNWKVVPQGAGANATAASAGFSATTSATITGMNPNTFYDLYVQTACDNVNQSGWSSPLTVVTTACNAPTNLIAFSVGYTNVTINWATISNVQDYTWKVVAAGAGPNGTAAQTGTSTGGPVTVTGLNSATAYQVYIRTNCDASATSIWSAPTSFTTNTCNIPTNITLSSVGFDVATLSWTPVPNVLSYNYKVVAAGAGINATAISAGTSTAPGAIASGLSASTSYDIYLQTNCNANVTSAWTIPITFTTLNCNPPINITPSNVNFTGANFRWLAIPNAAGYEWKVVLAGAGLNATAISSGTTAFDSVSVTGLTAGTDYDFYIKTNCSGAITSSYTNPYSFTTQNCITPTSLAIANILPGSATLTWSSVNFSAKYYWKVVLRGAGANAPAVATDSSTTSSAVIKGLTGLTAYEAYVRINCGPTTTSPWSAPIAFSTPLLPFNAPWTLGNTGWFNGVDDYATIALGLPNPNDFTIEFWARVENEQPDVAQSWFNTTDSYIPLIDRSSVLQTPYSIRYNPVTGYVKVFRTDGTNTPAEIIGTTSIKDGTYHHIAVTRNSLTYELKLYIDGILDGTEVDLTNATINPTGAQTLIAARTIFTNNSKLHFKGNIDDLRFWNVVREISDIQNAKETPLLGTEAGLIAYYDMENVISGNGQTIYSIVTPPLSATNALSTGTSTTPVFAHPCLTFNAKELGIKTTPTTATLKFTGNPLFFAGFDWKITASNAGAGTLGLFSGTTADTVTIAGFDPGIQYDLYVKTPCTDIWQGPISLTTQNVWHNALHFDGTNDNVSTGNGSSFATISTALSLELWVRPEDNTGAHYLFDKETASSSGGIALYTLNGIPTFDLKTSAWTSLSATDALPLNTWSHIAAVYTGTEMLLYVNGRVVGSTAKTGNIAPIAANGLIGKKYNNTGYFSGMLDECRIWNIARSTNQIQSNLYSFPAPNSTGFVAYYPLNESNISAAQDITSNANNASLSGFALIGSTSNWVPRSPLLSDPVIGLMVDNNVTVYDSVLNQGTAPILEKGFLWSVTNTTASSLVLGSSGTNRIVVSGTAFQADMVGLPLGAVIGYRGYAYSEDGIDYSNVMQNIPILCPAPYGIAASNVNTNSAQVNWTSLSGGTGYNVKVVYAGAGAGSTGIGTALYGNNMATITGLAALTSYDIYVSMNCTSVSSDWTGPVTITTLCNPVNLPVSQNFSGILGTLPSCWTAADLNQDEYKWGIDANGSALLVANPVMQMDDWLFSGGVNLTAGVSYRVSFKYGALSTTNTEKLSLSLGSTAEASAMSSTPLFVNSGFNAASLLSDLAFTAPTTGVYYLGWRGFSDGNTSGILLDSVLISVNPCGSAPSNLSVSAITASGASAFWNAVPSVSSYTWKVVPSSAGAAFTAVRTGTTTNLTANITGLLSGVAYDLFIKANCSANISSPWVGPIAFSTLTQTGLFASAGANDAYIDVNWALPVDNCLLNASSTPYPQGIHVELKDLSNNTIVYQAPIADLSPYIGETQPAFTRVANGLNSTLYQITSINTTPYWASNLTEWTLETWLKITPAINNAIIWAAVNGGSFPVELKMNGQNLILNNKTFDTPIPHSRWTHIALSFTGTTAILYLNGIAKDTINVPFVNMGNSGYSYQFLKNFTNGSMGELRLWNRVRSATEIANNRFATTIPNANLASTNLFLYLRWNTVNGGTTNTGYFSTLPIYFFSGTPPTTAYTPTPNYTPINGAFRHWVGPTQNRTYQLNVRQVGSGLPTVNCSTFTALGSTLAFQVPTLVAATDNSLDRVTLTWNNKSKLAERYKVIRSGLVRAIVLGTEAIDSVLTYEDIYNSADSNSVVNGTNYSYCVQALNNTLNQTYSQVCDNGKTFNLNLVASDNTYTDKVVLTWASVTSFNREIKVIRDNIVLATLAPTATTYTDNNILFGKVHKYEISLVDSLGIGLMSDFDTGSVPAKGQIKGRVLTLQGGYAVKNAQVEVHSLVDTSFRVTTYTNFKGEYAFNNLFYGDNKGQFELTAKYGNHKFVSNPKIVTLSDSIFVLENIVFQDSTGFTINPIPLAISNFTATPNTAQDRIEMAWNYTPTTNDSTIFEIYREAELLAVLSNAPTTVSTYTDLTGIPQASYKYRLFAYKIQNGTVTKHSLDTTTIFPAVTKPTTITATANMTLGLIDLAWTNTSTNIDGFNLYKNSVKIAELGKTTLTYTDLNLIPGSVNTYTVKARRKPTTITFESAATSSNSQSVPALPNLSTLTATASAANNWVNLVWTVPTNLNSSYNFTGYRIYRKKSTSTVMEYIAEVYKGRPNSYEDRTGLPASSYTYTVKTFKRMTNGTIVESAGLAKTATFPVVSPPTVLTASNNTVVGEVVMSWTPAYTNAARNIDGQIVFTGTDSVSLPATTNTYRFMTNQTVTSTFGVRTFRVVAGKRYFSNPITANAKPLASTTNPVLATKFKASQDLPNHIRLSWEYPAYVSSTFKIYRDNVPLATLGTTVRDYQDYTAVNGVTHLYHIQAINGTTASQKVGAWGRVKSILQLSGMVASTTGKVGMPNVDITASAPNFYVHTRTDSAGYYYIDGLPALVGTTISVLAEGVNSTFATATQTFGITSAKTYSVNFNNTFTPPALDTASPAKAIMLNAIADYARRRIVLSWNESNNMYDGVEVYRANTLLGTVNAGSNTVWYDTEGYPGISYVYSLRPFTKPTPTTKRYGTASYKAAVFPIIASVVYATATPKPEENKLTLTWAHIWNNHTYYAIERNNELMTTIPTSSYPIWDDLTGEPGKQYTYTITAVMTLNGVIYTSIPVSITTTYPSIGEVKNLTAEIPSNTVKNACLVEYQRSDNHVLISWQKSTTNVNGFRVYRDSKLLKELPNNVTAYQDYTGLPGSLHTYTVKAVLVRNKESYYSSGLSQTKTFPALAPPKNLGTPTPNSGAISLSWAYPEPVINGFYVYYNGASATAIPSDTIAIDSLGNGQFTYQHTTGIPGFSYRYAIRAYTQREGAIYLSPPTPVDFVCNGTTLYPIIPAPTNVKASDGLYEGSVVVTWDYPNNANVMRMGIYKDQVLLGTIPAGLHLYIDTAATGNAYYSLKAFRTMGGTPSPSDPSSDFSISDQGYPLLIANSLSPSTLGMRRYGAVLSASKELALIAAPGNNPSVMGYIDVCRFNSSTRKWVLGTPLLAPTGGGCAMSLSNDNVILGFPSMPLGSPPLWVGNITANNTFSGTFKTAVSLYISQQSSWDITGVGGAVANNLTGTYFSDIRNKKANLFWPLTLNCGAVNMVVSPTKDSTIISNNSFYITNQAIGKVMDGGGNGLLYTHYYEGANSAGTYIPSQVALLNGANTTYFTKPNGLDYNTYGYSLALSNQNDVIIGAPGYPSYQGTLFLTITTLHNGVVYIHNNGNTNPDAILYCPDISPTKPCPSQRFGASVDIEGNFAIVGAPDLNNGKGAAYLYHKKNNVWTYIKKYEYGNTSMDSVGVAVKVGNFAIIGAPNTDNGIGKIYLEDLRLGLMKNVTATNGIYAGKTRISWNFYPNAPEAPTSFEIYRDSVWIGSATSSDTYWDDETGVVGKHYLYQVQAKNSSITTIKYADEGWSKLDGYIAGKVSSLIGQSAIANVKITATAIVGNDKFTYTTVSDNSGNYNLTEVYYGSGATTYTVSAVYGKHIFVTNPITFVLSPQSHTKTDADFFDKTAYTIKGFVHRRNVNTGLDSIRVKATHLKLDGTSIVKEAYTDKEGNYSIVINPDELYLAKISITADNFRQMKKPAKLDSIRYHFAPQGIAEFTNFTNFPLSTIINIVDTTQYAARLSVLTACNTPLTGGKYRIKVQGIDAEYERTFTTSEFTGEVIAKLPPLNLNINVESVENLDAQTQLVVNYLKYRPTRLALDTLDRDTLYKVSSATILDNLTHRSLTYHKPPTISLISGFDVYMCSNTNKPAIIQQGQTYSLELQIQETFNGVACDVQSGYVVINNAAAVVSKDTSKFLTSTKRFKKYVFKAGNPNLVAPYSYLLNMRYFSNVGDLLGEKNIAVIVEGSSQLPGADVIVDASENGQVPIPIFVLRDPPGDGSSTTLEEGSTTTKTLSVTDEFGQNVFVGSEGFGAISTIGIAWSAELNVGHNYGDGQLWEITATTNKAISTFDDPAPAHIGKTGDVIMGVGVALQYGLKQQLKVTTCDTIQKTTVLGFSPNSVKTQWMYTLGQIELLVEEYKTKIKQVEKGTLKLLKPDGSYYTKEEAKKKLETLQKNWEQIVAYHKKETLPYYALCDKTGQQKAPEPYNQMADAWRNGFCPLVGTYDTKGNFNPKDKIVWDNELVNKYNAANTAIRKLESGELKLQSDLIFWEYDDFTNTNKFVDEQYNLLHGVQAKNLTFGSGVNYSETYESAESKSQSSSLSYYVDANIWLGMANKVSSLITAPTGGPAPEVFDEMTIPFKLGGGVSYSVNESHEVATENTNLLSYTLSDDDDADQFSVTVIQGPATNLGPYFSLLGGRSSCPQEEGTIVRDRPDLRLYEPQTQSTTTNQTKTEIPTDAPATFMLQIANLGVFNEARDFKLTMKPESNPNGAIVTTMGQNLGYGPVILYGVDPKEPLIVPINVQKGLNGYEYDGLKIAIEPYCGNTAEATDEANVIDSTLNLSVTMNVHFKNPCSHITLVEPDDNWVISRRNVFDPNSREKMMVKFTDYEPYNLMLQSMRLQYRKIGAGTDWQTIPGTTISRDSLRRWNELSFVASQVPYYPYFWDITDNFARYPDGDYEIRGVAECGVGGQVYSRYAKGKIARQGQLFNKPEPADHIWTAGDEISVAFNRDLECTSIADSNFIVRRKTQANSFLPGKVTCYNNKLLFTPTLPLRFYDGDSLELIVSNVRTDNGYLMDTVRWTFFVAATNIYVKPNTIKVKVNKGQEIDVNTILAHNSESAATINYTFSNMDIYNHWLSSNEASGAIAKGEELTLPFHINSSTMLLGTTTAILNLVANGVLQPAALTIEVTVLPAAPDWHVNPAGYTESMTLLSNFTLNDSTSAFISKDTMDVISVWIDNQIRGVAKISKFTSTNYAALIQVYGKSTDANKPLTFRVWDASAGKEYDARPDNNATVSYTTNSFVGSVGTPSLLDIFTASDAARYIPLNKGWSWLSVASTNWNRPVNQALASLKHPHTNDVIKTASKTASYLAGTGWVSTNGLDSTNAHRGYQIFLAEADTLRISGAVPSLKPISLANGWNLIGYPLQTEMPITSLNFSTTPTSMAIKTVATDPANYSTNMVATYGNSAWTYTAESKMDKLRPDFAYQLRVNAATQLLYPGANPLSSPIALRTSPAVDMADPSSWQVYPADFEHNQLITAVVDYNKTENTNAETKVLAYVGDECRGVGELVYVEELKRYMMQMMVYSNETDEPISFYVYDGQRQQSYDHHETLNFNTDNLVGKWEEPYHFSNVAADDAFTGSVYPNPFNRSLKLNLKSDKVQDFTVQLTDLTGRVLYTTAIDADNVNVSQTLNTQSLDLTDGVYLLQVVGSLGKTLSFKVVHQSN